jgi:hypothetical protein
MTCRHPYPFDLPITTVRQGDVVENAYLSSTA